MDMVFSFIGLAVTVYGVYRGLLAAFNALNNKEAGVNFGRREE